MEKKAKYHVGQLIQHKLFGYRGVIIDVDPCFLGSDDWYERMAKTKPPKDRPWYHVLMDGSDTRTYVAERNIEPDEDGTPIEHPDIDDVFEDRGEDGYVPRKKGH